MRNARSAFNDISFMNDLDGLVFFLIIASARGNHQDLTARMDMPVEFRTRSKRRVRQR
jgi:hypothetical protein